MSIRYQSMYIHLPKQKSETVFRYRNFGRVDVTGPVTLRTSTQTSVTIPLPSRWRLVVVSILSVLNRSNERTFERAMLSAPAITLHTRSAMRRLSETQHPTRYRCHLCTNILAPAPCLKAEDQMHPVATK